MQPNGPKWSTGEPLHDEGADVWSDAEDPACIRGLEIFLVDAPDQEDVEGNLWYQEVFADKSYWEPADELEELCGTIREEVDFNAALQGDGICRVCTPPGASEG